MLQKQNDYFFVEIICDIDFPRLNFIKDQAHATELIYSVCLFDYWFKLEERLLNDYA